MERRSDLSPAGQAVRALARSDLSVLRVPQDLEELARLGFPQLGTNGLAALVRLGLIRPIARGLYEVRDSTGVTRTSFEALLAARFSDTKHLATGWWALAERGLTNQDVREAIILTETNRRAFQALGRRARAARVNDDELWGGEAHESGLVVARPERALCDCAGRRPTRIPAARIAEGLEAFLDSDQQALRRLVTAVERFDSRAVARRLGYLVELIAGDEAAEPFLALTGKSHRADALDQGDGASPIVTKWSLRTSLTPEELLEHREVS